MRFSRCLYLALALVAAAALASCGSDAGPGETSLAGSAVTTSLVGEEDTAASLISSTVPNVVELLDDLGDIPAAVAVGESLVIESQACEGGVHLMAITTSEPRGVAQPRIQTSFTSQSEGRSARITIPDDWSVSSTAMVEVTCEVDGRTGTLAQGIEVTE